MVNIFKRMRKLQFLFNIRVGTGAATFPAEPSATKEFPAITRLHLTYARKIYGGHQGARHFWRYCLPRLKYHNPAVPMSVKQITEQESPATLTIYFAEQLSKAAAVTPAQATDKHAPEPTSTEKTLAIDVRNLVYRDIWKKVQMITGAKEIPLTPEDQAEQARQAKLMEESAKDRARVASIRQQKRDQERMLQEARGEIEKLKQL